MERENPNNETVNESTFLLILNDYCIMEVFQRLELLDFFNLASTCRRLRDVSNAVSVVNYNKIYVCGHRYSAKIMSKEQFSKFLSEIGQYVFEVEMRDVDQFVVEAIRDKCKNLNSMKLLSCNSPLQLEGFRNLKGLEVEVEGSVGISNNVWRKIFANNVNIEILYYSVNSDNYEEGFMELLTQLPKLRSLRYPWLPRYFYRSQDFQQLLRLDGLTKLSLQSIENCNKILKKLARKLKLVELHISMGFNANSLGIIKSFYDLVVLSMDTGMDFEVDWFKVPTDFPPSLKRVKIDQAKFPCSYFLSVVDHLRFLDEFDLGISGDIFLDEEKLTCLKDSRVISRIEDELRRNQRTLSIIHWNRNSIDLHYTHKSNQLTIINSLFIANQATMQNVYVQH